MDTWSARYNLIDARRGGWFHTLARQLIVLVPLVPNWGPHAPADPGIRRQHGKERRANFWGQLPYSVICPGAGVPPQTDYIRHAARMARKLHGEMVLGGQAVPDTEFWKTLAKALEETAAGLELVAKRD